MKIRCDIELPDNADWQTKLDAMAKASRDESMWKEIHTREELMKRTSFENKCGSCKHFRPWEKGCVNGECAIGHVWGARTRPKCKKYEKEKG